MVQQLENVKKLFDYLEEKTGGSPSEKSPKEGESFRFEWITRDDFYELFLMGDCLYLCGLTEKNAKRDQHKLLELLNWLNGWSHYGTFTFFFRDPKKISLEQTHFAYSDYKFEELFSFYDQLMKRMTIYYLSSDMVFEEDIPFEEAVDKAMLQMARRG